MPLDVRKAFGLPGSSFFRIVGYAQLLGAQRRVPSQIDGSGFASPMRGKSTQGPAIAAQPEFVHWVCEATYRMAMPRRCAASLRLAD